MDRSAYSNLRGCSCGVARLVAKWRSLASPPASPTLEISAVTPALPATPAGRVPPRRLNSKTAFDAFGDVADVAGPLRTCPKSELLSADVRSLEARILVPIIGMSLFVIFLVITVFATAGGALTVHRGAASYWVVLACFALSWYNTSTGWLAQLVTYPLFGSVPREGFVDYHTRYDSLIPLPVILPVILLMNGSVLLVWFHPSVITPSAVWAGTALQVLVALSTVLFQVPAHQRLQRDGFDPQVHRKLILSNWLRTVAGSAHALLSFWIVARVLGLAGTIS